MSMGMAMAEECSTHSYLMSPSQPLQGICPYCLTQRICFLKIQRKQVSSFSFYKKRRSNKSKSFFLSLFSKLHRGRCLPRRKSISSGHQPMAQARTNFSATFLGKPNFPAKIPVIRQALTTSGVHRLMEFFASIKRFQEWPIIWRGSKSTPRGRAASNGVKRREVSRIADHFKRKQEPATWKEMHPTALRPLAPHQGSCVEADGDNTSGGELFYSGQS
ncbi:hypothetical protein AMTR_s00164p00075790 [Amborella trichopoda]|uniref:Uncharacterized protein n=1 Tax=Amborella trichopoda TaxID=13333 RepID=W1PT92_AMBTC|nr:hypothetical protein AMTR_s00164p00075790 [Amborella trichopoda]